MATYRSRDGNARRRRKACRWRARGAAASGITSAATFSKWYRDDSTVNHSTATTLKLCRNAAGNYVNRWHLNSCDPWPITTNAYFCGNVGRRDPRCRRQSDPVHVQVRDDRMRHDHDDDAHRDADFLHRGQRQLSRGVSDRHDRRDAGVLPDRRRQLHARSRKGHRHHRISLRGDQQLSRGDTGGVAQLQLHQRGPLLVPVRRHEDLHAQVPGRRRRLGVHQPAAGRRPRRHPHRPRLQLAPGNLPESPWGRSSSARPTTLE